MNQDGRTQGLSMPNGEAQVELIRSVYDSAGLDVRDTGYVETHGTGTKVGDPIEAAALHTVFGEGRSTKEPLYIGSIKSNIGHAEGSSGILAIIKTALMLEKGFILPNIHFKKPNEAIPLAEWNLKVHKPASRLYHFFFSDFSSGSQNSASMASQEAASERQQLRLRWNQLPCCARRTPQTLKGRPCKQAKVS